MNPPQEFSLWLEFEIYAGGYPQPGDDPACDFCNAIAKVGTQTYAFNVWTFEVVDYIRRFDVMTGQQKPAAERFMLAPDLLVERLDRPTIEAAILALIEANAIPGHWRYHDRDEAST